MFPKATEQFNISKTQFHHATYNFPSSQLATDKSDLELENCQNTEKHKYWTQYSSVFTATLAMFVSGLHLGWVSPALPILFNQDSPIDPLTTSQSPALAGFLYAGSIFGPTLGSILCDTIGRKSAIIITAIPLTIGFFIIIFAETIYTLYTARLIAGLGVGASFAMLPLYIGEISAPNIRGTMGFFVSIQLALGLTIQYCTIPFIGITSNAILCSVLAFLHLCLSFFLPESPYYLLMKDQEINAAKALKFLRKTDRIEIELNDLKTIIKEEKTSTSGILDIIGKKTNLLGLVICCGLNTAQMFSGFPVVLNYTQVIFNAADSNLPPSASGASGITLQLYYLIVTVISTKFIDSWGRRPLLLTSAFTSVIPLFTIGLYFYLQSVNYPNISKISLLPLISLIVFSCTFYRGMNPMPHVYASEIFPPKVRATAATIMATYSSILGIIVTKLYQIISDAYGIHVGFWGFSICCFVSGCIFIVLIPETKGKSLLQIQTILKNKINQKNDEN